MKNARIFGLALCAVVSLTIANYLVATQGAGTPAKEEKKGFFGKAWNDAKQGKTDTFTNAANRLHIKDYDRKVQAMKAQREAREQGRIAEQREYEKFDRQDKRDRQDRLKRGTGASAKTY